MAITRINAPDSSPTSLSDWAKINNIFQVVGLNCGQAQMVVSGILKRGCAFFFAGTWYVVTEDYTPSGTLSSVIKITKSTDGSYCDASYYAGYANMTFSREWNHWVHTDGSYLVFDEMLLFGAGNITDIATINQWRPRGTQVAKFLTSQNADTIDFSGRMINGTINKGGMIKDGLQTLFGYGNLPDLEIGHVATFRWYETGTIEEKNCNCPGNGTYLITLVGADSVGRSVLKVNKLLSSYENFHIVPAYPVVYNFDFYGTYWRVQ